MAKDDKGCTAAGCAIRNILDRFGDKWSLLVISVLSNRLQFGGKEVLRFGELHKTIGTVSQKMLTVTLKTLEADGLVMRTAYPVIPPRVEYQLTDLGKSLVPHIAGLSKWAEENQTEILQSRKRYT